MDSLKLIDDYISWYKNNTIVRDFDSYSEIVTPYVNHLNDRVRLYLEEIDKDKIKISDDGQTFNELELLGIDVTTKTREKIISSILSQFGTSLEDDMIYIETDIKDFPKAKHKLLQAIIRTYDLVNTRRNIVTGLFTEEVQAYLYDLDIGGMPNVKLTGRSGIDYQVDYVLGAKKGRPEIWIQILNHFDFNSFTSLYYAYQDISEGRDSKQQAKKLLIYNDVENKPANKAFRAAEAEKSIITFPWSNKANLLELIG